MQPAFSQHVQAHGLNLSAVTEYLALLKSKGPALSHLVEALQELLSMTPIPAQPAAVPAMAPASVPMHAEVAAKGINLSDVTRFIATLQSDPDIAAIWAVIVKRLAKP